MLPGRGCAVVRQESNRNTSSPLQIHQILQQNPQNFQKKLKNIKNTKKIILEHIGHIDTV